MAARLGEAFADAVAASVGEGVYAVDLDGRLTYLNPAASAILGWREDELIGASMHDAIHSLDPEGNPRSAETCLLLKVTEDGKPVRVEDDVFVRKDGTLVPVGYTSSPMISNGEVVGAVVAFHDITHQKATQERLRSEAEVNEALLRIAGTLNAQRDVDTVVQLVTDAGTLLSGAAYGAFAHGVVGEDGERTIRWATTGGVHLVDDADETGVGAVFASMPASYLRVPVHGRGGAAVGSLHFGHPRPNVFTEQHARLVQAVAAHAAIAFENASESAFAKRVSETLQRSLLPRSLPVRDRVRVVARYQPAQLGVEVGGDWYDVIELDDERLAVVIGDVAGHDLHAASVMGEIRNAVRAYALDGHSPSGVVERANRFLCNVAPTELATCCYVELHPSEGTATVVLAGHPPPLLTSHRDAGYIDADCNVPLGVDSGARFAETTVLLPAGGTLVLYTDGLVDHPSMSLDDGFSRLAAAVALTPADLDAAADEILVATAGERADDAAVLLVALDPIDAMAETDVGRVLPSDPGSAAAARHFVSDVLADWGDDLVATAELLVSEVVTNAVLHSTGPVELRIVCDVDRVRIAVADESGERPASMPDVVDLEATSGRGLLLVDALSVGWGVEPWGVGKRVWFDLERVSIDA
ncbi:MAG TPA: SpoIIE family protein phosphatase [Acidimicrobiales bacterium]|nr:SpoIIE family protein phosphatase [Acidimicrobiales bacterium]